MDNFKSFLRNWLKRINENNQSVANEKKIILDERLFYKKKNGYYDLKEDLIKKCKSASYCFIGDNPGENEKNHGEYFYYEINDENRDERCAGSKIKELVDTLKGKGVIYFNKCLIYTPRTKDLKKGAIKKTEEFVCEFIQWLSELNEYIIFVFFGVSEKFKCIYKKLTKGVGRRSIITFHPCSSKYDKEDLSKKIQQKEIVKVKFDNDSYFCSEEKDDDDDNPDDLSGLSPILVR